MINLPQIASVIAFGVVLVTAGCSTPADAQSATTVVASTSPEADLCQRVAQHIGGLDGGASAGDFRDFSAQIANDLKDVESTVGVDLAIANSYAMLLGIDVSSYRDPQQRLDTAVDFVNALETYVSACTDLGVQMPKDWIPRDDASDPRLAGGRSMESS